MKPLRLAGPALSLAVLLLPMLGCGLSMLDIHLASHAQKQEHYEIIRALQPMLDRHERVPSSRLLFLAGAYSETRDYARLMPVCDLWQAQIEAGDNRMISGELSAMPHYLRAGAFLDLGDPAGALREAGAADAILSRQTYADNAFVDSSRIEAWGALGVAHALLGHPAQAQDCIRRLEALELGTTINGPRKFTAIAKIHMALGAFPKALEAVQNPKAEYHGLASMFFDHTFQAVPVAYIQAKCQFETGRLQEAKEGFDRLLKHPHLAEVGGLHWPVLLDRARIARGEGQEALAEDLLRQAVAVVERQRSSIGSEAGRIGFVGDKQACYQELVDLLVRAGRAPEAFGFVERAKGRALVDLLASQHQLGRPQDAQGTRLLAALDQTERDLQAIPDPSAPSRRGILVSARAELAAQAPTLASLVLVPDLAPGDLQARLGADETLLEYYAAGPRWMVFVVTPKAITVQALETGDLPAKVRDLRLALTDPASDPAPAAADLYLTLLAPIAGQVRTAKLTIVPHGVLHYVPFSALGTREGGVLDRYSLRFLPSATLLTVLLPRKVGGGSLILGNPDLGRPDLDLPFAQEEATALAAILPGPALRLRGAATLEALSENQGRYGIIHVAAHGTFDDAQPLESALLLASTPRTRGTLKVADLYHLDLDADLVTLSACETAMATVSRGDDVVGFTRGLLYAGSRSVLSSLWKVDDQCTRDLMVAFYRNRATLSKTEALRRAQLQVRAAHPHPFYWAAFMVTGNDE